MSFSGEQFFNVFTQYNTAIWPFHIVLNLLALAALVLAFSRAAISNRLIAAILAFLWVWTGLVYHLIFFTTINPAAYLFGALFILQGLLFVLAGGLRQTLSFQPHRNVYTLAGGFFMLYGLLIYPILGYFLGHVFPHSPTFGAPCPTVIFTFGLLLWTDKKLPKYLLVIPFLWSLLGISAAIQWGVLEDVMLIISGVVATAMIVYRDRTESSVRPAYLA